MIDTLTDETKPETQKPEPAFGKLLPKNTLLFRSAVGEMTVSGGKEYSLTNGIPNGALIVCSKQSGRYFIVTFPDAVQEAIRCGIDDEEETEEETENEES